MEFSEPGCSGQSRMGRYNPGNRYLLTVILVTAFIIEIFKKAGVVKQLTQPREQSSRKIDASFGSERQGHITAYITKYLDKKFDCSQAQRITIQSPGSDLLWLQAGFPPCH